MYKIKLKDGYSPSSVFTQSPHYKADALTPLDEPNTFTYDTSADGAMEFFTELYENSAISKAVESVGNGDELDDPEKYVAEHSEAETEGADQETDNAANDDMDDSALDNDASEAPAPDDAGLDDIDMDDSALLAVAAENVAASEQSFKDFNAQLVESNAMLDEAQVNDLPDSDTDALLDDWVGSDEPVDNVADEQPVTDAADETVEQPAVHADTAQVNERWRETARPVAKSTDELIDNAVDDAIKAVENTDTGEIIDNAKTDTAAVNNQTNDVLLKQINELLASSTLQGEIKPIDVHHLLAANTVDPEHPRSSVVAVDDESFTDNVSKLVDSIDDLDPEARVALLALIPQPSDLDIVYNTELDEDVVEQLQSAHELMPLIIAQARTSSEFARSLMLTKAGDNTAAAEAAPQLMMDFVQEKILPNAKALLRVYVQARASSDELTHLVEDVIGETQAEYAESMKTWLVDQITELANRYVAEHPPLRDDQLEQLRTAASESAFNHMQAAQAALIDTRIGLLNELLALDTEPFKSLRQYRSTIDRLNMSVIEAAESLENARQTMGQPVDVAAHSPVAAPATAEASPEPEPVANTVAADTAANQPEPQTPAQAETTQPVVEPAAVSVEPASEQTAAEIEPSDAAPAPAPAPAPAAVKQNKAAVNIDNGALNESAIAARLKAAAGVEGINLDDVDDTDRFDIDDNDMSDIDDDDDDDDDDDEIDADATPWKRVRAGEDDDNNDDDNDNLATDDTDSKHGLSVGAKIAVGAATAAVAVGGIFGFTGYVAPGFMLHDDTAQSTAVTQQQRAAANKIQGVYRVGDMLELVADNKIVQARVTGFINDGAIAVDSSNQKWLVTNAQLKAWLDKNPSLFKDREVIDNSKTQPAADTSKPAGHSSAAGINSMSLVNS